MYAIETFNLTRKYAEKSTINDLKLAVKYGEIFGLLGASGEGKTTILRLLATVIPPTSGDAVVCGYSISVDPAKVRRTIAVMPDGGSLNPILSVAGNIQQYLILRGNSWLKSRALVAESLKKFDLAEYKDCMVSGLAPAIRRRVELVRTLISDCQLVFLDEPTAGLDQRTKHLMWDYIRSARTNGKTIFFTTQSLEEAEALADRVCIMKMGNAVEIPQMDMLKSSFGHISAFIKMGNLPRAQEQMLIAFLEKWDEPVEIDYDKSRLTLRVIGMSGISSLLAFINANRIPVTSLSVKEPALDEFYFKIMGEK